MNIIHLLLREFSFKAIAIAFNIYDRTMMQQAIQKGRYDDRVMEQFRPIWKGFVWGDNRTGFFISDRDETKE